MPQKVSIKTGPIIDGITANCEETELVQVYCGGKDTVWSTVMFLSFWTDRGKHCRSSLIRVYTACYPVYIFWANSVVKQFCSNFRIITAIFCVSKFLGVFWYISCNYSKNPKNWDTLITAVNIQRFEEWDFTLPYAPIRCRSKDKQCRPCSDLLFVLV